MTGKSGKRKKRERVGKSQTCVQKLLQKSMEEEANALLSIQQSQFTSMISHDK